MRYMNAIIVAMMVFAIYFIIFGVAADSNLRQQGAIGVIVAVGAGVLTYFFSKSVRKKSSE